MTTENIILAYKGYNYQSITPYEIDSRCVGWKDNVEVVTSVYRVLAGQDEHSTPLIMFQNVKGDWKLECETEAGDCSIQTFFKSHGVTKSEIKEAILKMLQNGFAIKETERGYLYIV